MESEFFTVTLYGIGFLATHRPDGSKCVSVRHVCESIGIDFAAQLTKLKRCEWAILESVSFPDRRGRLQPVVTLDLESLPMWLATIRPGKVAPIARERVEAFQVQASEALRGTGGELISELLEGDEVVEESEGDVYDLVPVPFRGEAIFAAKLPSGNIVVSIRHICESLGVDVAGQLRKLKDCDWATVDHLSMVDPAGRRRKTSVIDARKLPMWLGGIESKRVAPEVRQKLAAYQTEAAEVLARHFMPSVPAAPVLPVLPPDADGLTLALYAAMDNRIRLNATEKRVDELERKVEAAALEARNVSSAVVEVQVTLSGDTGLVSLVGYCSVNKISLSRAEMAKYGGALSRQCKALGLPVKKVSSDLWGEVNAYPREVLDQWRESLQRGGGAA